MKKKIYMYHHAIYANILSGMDHVLSSECYRQYKDNQVVCFFTEEIRGVKGAETGKRVPVTVWAPERDPWKRDPYTGHSV